MRVIARNIMALVASQVATWILSIVMLALVPRYLGDKQFGQLSFAGSFVGFFGLLTGLSGGAFITKETARDPSRVGRYVFNGMVMGALLSLLLSVAAIVVARLLGYPPQTLLLIGALCIGMILGAVGGPIGAGLQGQQRMGKLAILGVVSTYLSSAVTVVILVSHKGLIALALATSLVGVIGLAGSGLLLWRDIRADAHLDLRLWKTLARGSFPFMLWGIVLTIYGSIDTPMLSKLAGDAPVGWYAVAYRLVGIPVFLASIIVTVIFPSLSAQGGSSSFFTSLANRALRAVSFGMIPMAAGVALVAGDVIHLFHYGSGFTHAVPLIQILALHIPVVGITMVLGSAIQANDRQRRWVIVGIIAAVVNPLLNLVAIPTTIRVYGNGAVGASIITVATELVMLTGALYLRPRGVLDGSTARYMGRCVLACIPLIAAVIAVGGAPLAEKVLVGVAAYGAASLFLRTTSPRKVYHTGLQFLDVARPSRASSIL